MALARTTATATTKMTAAIIVMIHCVSEMMALQYLQTTITTATRRPLVLGDTCSLTSGCQESINHSICTWGVCVCAEGYFQKETRCYADDFVTKRSDKKGYAKVSKKPESDNAKQGKSTLVDTQFTTSTSKTNPMSTSEEVTDDTSTVLTTTETSTTTTTTTTTPTTQRPLVLGKRCSSTSDCQKNINHSRCTAGVCACANGYVQKESRCYTGPRNLKVTSRNNCVDISWDGDDIDYTVYINISSKYTTTFKTIDVIGTKVDCSSSYPGTVNHVMVTISGSNIPSVSASVTIAPSSPERLNITFVNDTCLEAKWSPGQGVTEQYLVTVSQLGKTKQNETTVKTSWSYCGLSPGELFNFTVHAISNSVLSHLPASVFDYTNPSKPKDGRLQKSEYRNFWRVDINWSGGSDKDTEFVVTVKNRTGITPSAPRLWGSEYWSYIHMPPGLRFTIIIQAVKHGKKSFPLQLIACADPGKVESLTVVSSGYNWIELDWTPPSGDVDSFQYEVTVQKPGSPEQVYLTYGDSYRVKYLTPGTNYTFKVRVKFCNLTSGYVVAQGATSLDGLSKFEVDPLPDSLGLKITWEHSMKNRHSVAFQLTVSENNETVIYNQNITQSPLRVTVGSFGKCFLVTLLVTGSSRTIHEDRWVSTPEKVLDAVENFSGRALNATCLLLEWDYPINGNSSDVHEFVLRYKKSSDTSLGKTETKLTRDTSLLQCGLHYFTNYTLSIAAVNKEGEGRVQEKYFQTAQFVPDAVTNLTVQPEMDINKPRTLSITWKEPVNKYGVIRAYYVIISNSTGIVREEKVLPEQEPYHLQQYLWTEQFTVEVFAETNGGNGSRVNSLTRIPEGVLPPTQEEIKVEKPMKEHPDTSAVAELPASLLCNHCYGSPVHVGLIVSKSSEQLSGERQTGPVPKVYKSWTEDKSLYYVRVELAHHCQESPGESFKVLLGGDGNCAMGEKFCNGFLTADTEYRFQAVMCTSAGCTYSPVSSPYRTDKMLCEEFRKGIGHGREVTHISPTVFVVVVVVCLVIIFCLSVALYFTLKRLRAVKVDVVAEQADCRHRDSISTTPEKHEIMRHRTELPRPLPYGVKKPHTMTLPGSRGGNAQNETTNGNEGERTSKKSDSSTSSPGQAAGNGSKSGGSTPRSSSSGSDKPSTNPNYTSTALQEVEIHAYMDLHTRDPTYASTTSSKDPHTYMELKTLRAQSDPQQPGGERNGNDGYETPQMPGRGNQSSDGYETPQPPREGRRRSALYANQGISGEAIQEEVDYYNEA